MKKAQKGKFALTATAHLTFPSDYRSKTDLKPEIFFSVESGNRNPHVHKYDLRHSATSKGIFAMQR